MNLITQIMLGTVVLGMPLAANADDAVTKVTHIAATSDYTDVIGYGKTVQTPTFTLEAGSPVKLPDDKVTWAKKTDNGKWYEYDESTFVPGTYKLTVMARIDDPNYTFSTIWEMTVNGTEWTTKEPIDKGIYTYAWADSPEIVVAKEALNFVSSSDFDIPESAVGQPIKSVSVASGVTGGKAPYTFSKVSGPDWITVSADGVISGTPTDRGVNSNLTVRVTDAESATAEMTVAVGITKWIAITDVAATCNYAHIIGYGKPVTAPTFNKIDDSFTQITTSYWQKKISDDNWYAYEASSHPTFEEGTYRVRVWVFANYDSQTDYYVIGDPWTFSVNGTEWETISPSGFYVNNFGTAFSPEITVVKDVAGPTPVTDVVATSNYLDIIGYGKPITTPTFTMADGSIADIPMSGWVKKVGENVDDWIYYDPSVESTFEAGTYLLFAQVIVNDPDYYLDNTWSLTVNGTAWTTNNAQDEGTYWWGAAMSPEIIVNESGIDNVSADGKDAPANIYNLQGIVVKRDATDLGGLPSGLYIIGGKKVLVK